MSITRWDPFREMVTLREAMQNLLEDSVVAPRTAAPGSAGNLALDVRETPDTFVVSAALPGVDPDNVDISVLGATVRIQAETTEARETPEPNGNGAAQGRWIARERRYGAFQRVFTLPSAVKAEEAQATFEHGVLTLTLPKVEEAKPRAIKVKAAGAIAGAAAETAPASEQPSA